MDANNTPVKITSLELENVKRIRACTLTPNENGLTVIGGRNNQGKTSILDAIAWALGGERYRPSQPKRDGSVIPPRLHLKLSNGIVVERSGKNSDLKVTDPEGRRAGQQLLNDFVEQLALDLPKFLHSTDKEKATALLKVIGVEEKLVQLDRQESELYNDRLAIGRIADQKAKFAKEMPDYPNMPAEPVSVTALIQAQQEILARNGENQRKRHRRDELAAKEQLLAATAEQQRAQLAATEEALAQVRSDLETARRDALDLLDESTEELEESIRGAEEINRKVRANLDKEKAETDAADYRRQYETLTGQIEHLRQEREQLLESSPLPLPGLSVEKGLLTYQGQQWDNLSGSDQLKVATAIVRAVKPQCGFVLVDKLEQMDLDTMQEFSAWAESEGLQVIATRVSTGGECSIIISDGYAEGTEEREQPAAPSWKAGVF